MYSFHEWADHYGYSDTPAARSDYQRYLDRLALAQGITRRQPEFDRFYVVQDRDLPDGRRLLGDIVAGPFDTRDQAQAALKDRRESGARLARWTDEREPLSIEERRSLR
ncbi:hypothetical protein [Thioalkalivibrio sp. ALJ16]|uniref:hypothetical protein n=1 Tax=Thioalkalivibrio sp. ALJ16 TaxID=1158762 RepID=UPI0003681E3B|nr:hypothetical protein [Thioalkalivibrio sp. ALJ16]